MGKSHYSVIIEKLSQLRLCDGKPLMPLGLSVSQIGDRRCMIRVRDGSRSEFNSAEVVVRVGKDVYTLLII